MPESQRDFCDTLLRYQVRTRNKDLEYEEPAPEQAAAVVRAAETLIQWLTEKR